MPSPSQITVLLPDDQPSFSFNLPPEATFQDWKDTGAQFVLAGRMLNWLIGDWLIAGSERFGAKALDHANIIFRRDIDRLSPIVDTCRKFPPDQRHEALTFTHHQIAARADDPNAVLTDAEREGMTCAALRARVRVQHPILRLEDDDPEDTAMRLIAQAWNRAPVASRESFLELANEAGMGEIEL